jgi:hypothetical protein
MTDRAEPQRARSKRAEDRAAAIGGKDAGKGAGEVGRKRHHALNDNADRITPTVPLIADLWRRTGEQHGEA